MTTPHHSPAEQEAAEPIAALLATVQRTNLRARRARALYFSAPERFIGPPLPPDAIEAIRAAEHQAALDSYLDANPPTTAPIPEMVVSGTVALDRCQADRIASALITLLTACERVQLEQPARRFLNPRVRPRIEAYIRLLRPA